MGCFFFIFDIFSTPWIFGSLFLQLALTFLHHRTAWEKICVLSSVVGSPWKQQVAENGSNETLELYQVTMSPGIYLYFSTLLYVAHYYPALHCFYMWGSFSLYPTVVCPVYFFPLHPSLLFYEKAKTMLNIYQSQKVNFTCDYLLSWL